MEPSNVKNNISTPSDCPLPPQAEILLSNKTDRNLTNHIIRLGTQASSGKDVEDVLNSIRWEVFLYDCSNERACENSTSVLPAFQSCLNSSCCFANDVNLIYTSRRCDTPNCTSFITCSLISKWYLFLLLGLISLFGNAVVVYQKLTSIGDKNNKHKEIQIYNILVLNLSCADLLMGFYLISISLEIKRKVNQNIYFSDYIFCNALGIINFTSSQVSLTILVIISFYRVFSIFYPYRQQRLKFVSITVLLTWLVWLMVAVLPVIPTEILKSFFTLGIEKDRQLIEGNFIDFLQEEKFFASIMASSFNHPEMYAVASAIRKFPTVGVLTRALVATGWLNLKTDDWAYAEFYNIQYACSVNYLVRSDENRPVHYYILSIVLYNLTASVSIILAYLMLSLNLTKRAKLSCFCWKEKRNKTPSKKDVENEKVLRRISIVVVTDIMCWLPLCLTSLTFWVPTNSPDRSSIFLHTFVTIQSVMLIVIPFNSIVNPYIYSFHLWKKFLKRLKQKSTGLN